MLTDKRIEEIAARSLKIRNLTTDELQELTVTEIAQMSVDNKRLLAEIKQLRAELEAAKRDLNTLRKRSGWKCFACRYSDDYDRGVCTGCEYNNGNNWQWRGAQPEGE